MPEHEASPQTPEGIQAYDQDGREVLVPRDQWAGEVLPNMLREAWDKPDQLYFVIVNSLNQGFLAEMTEAAQHLHQTDTMPARGTCVWGIVLLQLDRLDDAEEVLAGYLGEHGEDASVLVNLAKVYAAKGLEERSQETLWHSLQLEPNLDVGLAWFASSAQERGGDQAATAALELLRAMPASWRAQLWLARAQLDNQLDTQLDAQSLTNARALYAEALERAPRPVPSDVLMQMSGDLGGHGHPSALLELTAPHFVPEVHGLPVGNNLLKASLDLGRLDQADAIVQSLSGFNRPDWRDQLAVWSAEIARRRGITEPAAHPDEAQIQIGMLRVDGPVWLPHGSRARPIFPAKAAGAVSVTFLGGSAEAPEVESPEAGAGIAGALGRMTRSLPLYLAEQTGMRTAANGRAMLPWAVGAPGGFVVSGSRWPDATAVQAVSVERNLSDYVVTVHIDAEVEPWTAMLAFLRASDGVRIGEIEVEFASTQPEAGLPRLADEVVELLSAFGPTQQPAEYALPAGAHFRDYLLRLEQLLAVRCATMEGIPAQFMTNEREIIAGEFALCEATPRSIPARLLLLETLGAMERIRPEVANEFRARFIELANDKPLPTLDAAFAPTTKLSSQVEPALGENLAG